MKRIFRIVLLVLFAYSTSSCFTMMAVSAASNKAKKEGVNLGKENASMTLRTFQRIAWNAALASTGRGDVVCVIADFGDYYDGKIINGRFIRKGTYSYISQDGVNKTVLVYLYSPNRKRLEKYADDFINNQVNPSRGQSSYQNKEI